MRTPPQILFFIHCILFVSLASAQIVIKDTVEITPKRIPYHSTFAPPIIGGGYTATYSIFSTQVSDSRARKITFGKNITVIDLGCSWAAYGGVFTATDSNVASFIGVEILAYTCQSGAYSELNVTKADNPSDSFTQDVFFNGAPAGSIKLQENVPLPTIQISYPSAGTIVVSGYNQPVIIAREVHTPSSGVNEPQIHWLTNTVIDTRQYYDSLKSVDTIAIPLSVKATNIRGTVSAQRTILLVREQLLTSFRVNLIPDTLAHNDTLTIRVQALDEIGKPMVLPDDYALFFYLDANGEQYGNFLAPGSTEPQKSLSGVNYGDAKNGKVRYTADGTTADSLSPILIGVIKISFRPKGGFATAWVKGGSVLDHFKVTFEKDTVAFTESAKIFVQAKDANDQDVQLGADKLVKLSVTTNSEYGTFIDKNGDTLKTIPVTLEHVLYGDAKAGLIQFAAVKKNPTDPLLSKVQVILESDPTKEGKREIPVVEQTLRIVMDGVREVEPRNLSGLRTADCTEASKREQKRI